MSRRFRLTATAVLIGIVGALVAIPRAQPASAQMHAFVPSKGDPTTLADYLSRAMTTEPPYPGARPDGEMHLLGIARFPLYSLQHSKRPR